MMLATAGGALPAPVRDVAHWQLLSSELASQADWLARATAPNDENPRVQPTDATQRSQGTHETSETNLASQNPWHLPTVWTVSGGDSIAANQRQQRLAQWWRKHWRQQRGLPTPALSSPLATTASEATGRSPQTHQQHTIIFGTPLIIRSYA